VPAYRLELSPRAGRDLKKLPAQVQVRLKAHIDALAKNPRPHGVSKLRGDPNAYRIRVGDYRVLYEVHDQVLVVIVLKVADRKEAYR
jgi:mRNA interferase RelE/StbE